ncbi:MAG: hypothetical protein AAGC73_07540 [Verrucomicrobiota bacterium]
MKNQMILQIRFVAFLCFFGGLLLLARNLVLSYDSFNPSYLGHYFKQEVLGPLVLILGGSILRAFAKRIAACICKDID